MAVLAHPDDESLGFGGTLARYASEGVDVSLLTATRGDAGRYRGHPPDARGHPGARCPGGDPRARAACGSRRAGRPRLCCSTIRTSSSIRRTAEVDRRHRATNPARPARRRADVRADGAYGHPDHIAVSQFTTAAIVAAAAHATVRSAAIRRTRLEALLPGVAGDRVGGLSRRPSGASSPPSTGRATGHALARLGHHNRDRYARILAHGVAGGLVSRIAVTAYGGCATCRRKITKRCGARSRSIARSASSTAGAARNRSLRRESR